VRKDIFIFREFEIFDDANFFSLMKINEEIGLKDEGLCPFPNFQEID